MAKIAKVESERVACGVNHDRSKKCFWKLVRNDRSAVFETYGYATKEEAITDASFHNLSGYHPEHFESSVNPE